MKRINVLVAGCAECLHVHRFPELPGCSAEWCCTHPERRKPNKLSEEETAPAVPPHWCPLPDANEPSTISEIISDLDSGIKQRYERLLAVRERQGAYRSAATDDITLSIEFLESAKTKLQRLLKTNPVKEGTHSKERS